MNKNYFFTILASLTLPSLSNIQTSLILRSTTAKFDSRRYLSIFCFADLSCTRHNQSKLCFCSRFGKVHSVLKIQDVAWVRKSLQAVFSLTLRNVTMHRISFADTAASRQNKQACSALDFCSVSFADLAGVRQLKQASLLSLMQGWRPHSKLKSTDFVYVAWPRDSK